MSLLESRVNKPDKTVNRSFRISEKAYKALEEGAVRGKVSLNTFVNQLFLDYAEFDRYASKLHSLDTARTCTHETNLFSPHFFAGQEHSGKSELVQ